MAMPLIVTAAVDVLVTFDRAGVEFGLVAPTAVAPNASDGDEAASPPVGVAAAGLAMLAAMSAASTWDTRLAQCR